MREIKFRAWDKVAKKMIVVDSLVWDVTGQLLSLNSGNFSELMQYTGLKDKNGKEIYEGDIVRGRWYFDKEDCIETVNMDAEFAGFSPFCHYDSDCNDYYLVNQCEVIGNIYENPELLELGSSHDEVE